MNDDELIGYCEIHCKTDRALFNADMINRMVVLAGLGEHNAKVVGWHSMHEEMQELVDLARTGTASVEQPERVALSDAEIFDISGKFSTVYRAKSLDDAHVTVDVFGLARAVLAAQADHIEDKRAMVTQPLIAEAAGDDRVDDLSMLVRRLVHALSKAAPDHTLPAKAVDYLQRKGLQGSPLRDDAVKRDDVAADAKKIIIAFNELKNRLQGIMRYDDSTGTYSIPATEFLDSINVIQDAAIAASTKEAQ